MPAKLYAVHGSHPCEAVKRAMDLKGVDYKTVEFPPPFHAPFQKLRFGKRTVPGIRFEDGEKLTGSSPILRRLDELAPEPRMFPDERVTEAEAWGEDVLQSMARRILWRGLALNPMAMHGFQGGKLPPLPRPMIRVMAPLVVRAESKMNAVSDEAVRADLQALGGHLARVDSLIADGVIGGETPNAADLQIASSLRLIMTVQDLAPLFGDRPAAELARRLFPDQSGEVPAGTFPSAWLPTNSSSSSASRSG